MFSFLDALKELNISLNEKQINQFEQYYNMLVSYNEKVNLTAITEKEDVYIKHFYDSILVSKVIDLNNIKNIADVGSGAGFPSIPLKILYPHLEVTIIDSLEKRLVFLKELANTLGLGSINLVHERAEDYKEGKEHFDLVTARAVARQNIVNELCIPLTKIGGFFLSMKGANFEEELKEGNSLNILGGKVENIYQYELPLDSGKRAIIAILHENKTPLSYPRNFGQIKKKPL